MGIRFQCHQCQHSMHVKDFLAGKKSRCPTCQTRFRIPASGEARSLPVGSDESPDDAALANEVEGTRGVVGSALSNAAMWLWRRCRSLRKGNPFRLPSPFQASERYKRRYRRNVQVVRASAERRAVWTGIDGGPYRLDPTERVTADSLIWREGWTDWTPLPKRFPLFLRNQLLLHPLPRYHRGLSASSGCTNDGARRFDDPADGFDRGGLRQRSTLQESTFSAQQKAMLRLKKKKKKQLQIVALLSLLRSS